MAREYDATLVLTGSPGDRPIVDDVRAKLPDEVAIIDLAGELELPILGAVLERCLVFITGDTGPMHLAAAVGTPTVAVFGPSDPARYAPHLDASSRRAHRSAVRALQSHQAAAHAARATRPTAWRASPSMPWCERRDLLDSRRRPTLSQSAACSDITTAGADQRKTRRSSSTISIPRRAEEAAARGECVDQGAAACRRERQAAAGSVHVSRRFAVVVRGAVPAQAGRHRRRCGRPRSRSMRWPRANSRRSCARRDADAVLRHLLPQAADRYGFQWTIDTPAAPAARDVADEPARARVYVERARVAAASASLWPLLFPRLPPSGAGAARDVHADALAPPQRRRAARAAAARWCSPIRRSGATRRDRRTRVKKATSGRSFAS